MMNMKRGLLDELVDLTGCHYMSDLHAPFAVSRVRREIDKIGIRHYEAREWQEAFSYITGKTITEGTEEEVRAMFKREKVIR